VSQRKHSPKRVKGIGLGRQLCVLLLFLYLQISQEFSNENE